MERNLSVELRPKSFDEFLGCDDIINAIKEGLRQGRMDSTYVITGPPGTGKTSLARAIIYHVNGKLNYYDITEPSSSELGADDIRPLIEAARVRPQWGNYKGIILNEAQKIVGPTQDILLTAMEEPCNSTIWLVTSSEPAKLREALRRRGAFYEMKGLNQAQTETLILRAIDYVGGAVKEKYRPQYKELAKALVEHEVTSAGFILRAVEKFITGVPISEAAQVSETTPSVDTGAIAKAVWSGNWEEAQKHLRNAPLSSAKEIRSRVAGYFRSVLVGKEGGGRGEPLGSPKAIKCVWAIQQLADLSNQGQFEDGMVMSATCAALYRICEGQAKKG